ncbi:hypothetical protein KSF78_0009032 [Schistosoma japonicum]|nr:hypothetical protein KSF78_0009032 [Schistosoma japonicum]
MSNKEWWRPNKLPSSGYQSDIVQHNENKSFYPFSSELGYRVYQRIIKMKSGSIEHQNHADPIHSIYHTGENNHVNLKGAYSQSSLSMISSYLTYVEYIINGGNCTATHSVLTYRFEI